MKHKGFTLVELLVVLTIFATIGLLIFGGVNAYSSANEGDDMPLFYAPEFENARSQRKIADEMQRQNDLLERQLNMQQQNAEQP